ncbi:MAG: gluconate kinase [Chitinophagaceae bacterium]|nr:gluconate kinase [Chitinophagaceae bacterium]
MYIAGIDIGTGSVKAIAVEKSRNIIASAQIPYEILEPEPGHIEQDPVIIKNAVISCINLLLKQTNPSDLAGLSFSAAMHSIMAVDRNGDPLTHALLWGDIRSTEETEQLKKSGAAKELYECCGVPVHPVSPLTKIMWLKENQPDIFEKAHKFISLKEFIFFCLFNEYVIDHSIASATGMFDIHQLQWNPNALSFAGISTEKLSAIVPVTSQFFLKNESVIKELGIGKNIPFIIGSSDGCLANIASGLAGSGHLSVTIGTSAAVRVCTTAPFIDEHQRLFNYVITKDLYACGGPSNNGGIAVKWMAENFIHDKGTALQSQSHSGELEGALQEAFSISPGCDGLIFLPYLLGERAPVWNANAKGLFYGIQFHHSRKYFARSVIEGVVMNLYVIVQQLQKQLKPGAKIIASGGFVHSQEWLQLLADMTNMPVCIVNDADASAMGAAILGWYSLGEISSLDVEIKIEKEVLPQDKEHQVYMKNYSVFRELLEKLF